MNTVYHYCSADTFLNIIKYKKLWLSDIEHMNDFKEMKWFLEAFEEIISDELNEDEYKRIHKDVLDNLDITRGYMCCLSEDGDILSQWRGYAQDGQGISIGFYPEKLGVNFKRMMFQNKFIKNSFFLNKVHYYSKNEIREIIIEALNSNEVINNFYSSEDRDFGKIDNSIQEQIVSLISGILHMCIHTKNPSFAEEKEVRLVYNNMPTLHNLQDKENKEFKNFLSSKNYRISNQNLCSYYEFPLPINSIKEIILGPKNRFNETDIKDFLQINKIYHNVTIKRSEASYR